MNKFSLDDIVRMAQHSKWQSWYRFTSEQNFWGFFKMGKKDYVELNVQKYYENPTDTYRLVAYYSGEVVHVSYGEEAARILKIAQRRIGPLDKFMWLRMDNDSRADLRRLKRHMERYGK